MEEPLDAPVQVTGEEATGGRKSGGGKAPLGRYKFYFAEW